MEEFAIIERVPTVSEYQHLRQSVGWYDLDVETTNMGLQNSLFSICATYKGNVIGCGRIVGDSAVYYYIQDMIVLPEFQGKGIGKKIMDELLNYLKVHAKPNAFIGLMAAKGFCDFYKKYGFSERAADSPGMFMIWKK